MRTSEDRSFLVWLGIITLAFGWLLWPFSGALLWATLLAIIFAPVYRRFLEGLPEWRNLAALSTVIVVVVLVLIPVGIVIASLIDQGGELYQRIQAGEIDLTHPLQQLKAALPGWATSISDRLAGIDLSALKERLSGLVVPAGQQLAGHAINIGQLTLEFVASLLVMLYLLFFFLRDGEELNLRIRGALPLRAGQTAEILDAFILAVRGTIKGIILVALIQGALGGLIFWLLGLTAPLLAGAIMALLSLLPVLGSALVWVPAGLYLLVSGAVTKGIILLAFGTFVIGLADNFLRPVLVGQSIRMPSYVVLLATLGGLATFGANGFVIGPLVAAMFLTAWSIYGGSKERLKVRE
ncbi:MULTISPECIES: AI-2E family transporter [unclassified Bradyrhizobium]|uniref:AI-2E family transporter n=1 Tax=unclassified Bradyrhizobium TaxID=2631580 RepID=UPI00211DC8AA|nr:MULTISPECIES: AI-2E family transporter [unclassified Bradyrhizobium]MDD1531993.1 AI-2E family transporter [Bradyrhizobium sp. WBOS8]MDD1585034.1 AI-2E family transporter [Bradyrhizobium sp. WBOS4]UUO46135.1 AI-2E family transporter [Bradyrhizobium sp. WBOS04]UUO60097.1 AI-2E family transporter [Bradyrhizobium sp. WBOS08]